MYLLKGAAPLTTSVPFFLRVCGELGYISLYMPSFSRCIVQTCKSTFVVLPKLHSTKENCIVLTINVITSSQQMEPFTEDLLPPRISSL